MKTCSKCRQQKPTTEFRRCSAARDGLHNYCKPCHVKSSMEWRDKNRERFQGNLRRWVANNPEAAKQKAFARNHARRARLLAAPGTTTQEEREALAASYANRCVYCYEPSSTFDHVTPLARGGCNHIGNLVPSCVKCNQRKNSSTLLEFLIRKAA